MICHSRIEPKIVFSLSAHLDLQPTLLQVEVQHVISRKARRSNTDVLKHVKDTICKDADCTRIRTEKSQESDD